jgi:hypothetical protein
MNQYLQFSNVVSKLTNLSELRPKVNKSKEQNGKYERSNNKRKDERMTIMDSMKFSAHLPQAQSQLSSNRGAWRGVSKGVEDGGHL